MQEDDSSSDAQGPRSACSDSQLARVAIKQVKMTRADAERQRAAKESQSPMNQLVPYLDLFGRLQDDELSRLACVPQEIVADLRRQVSQVKRGLARYVDLLPRLSDEELARISRASVKTVRFWRLCRPKAEEEHDAKDAGQRAAAAAAPAAAQPQRPQAEAESAGIPEPITSQQRSSMEGLSGEPFPGFEASSEELEDDDELDLEVRVFGEDEDELRLEDDDEPGLEDDDELL